MSAVLLPLLPILAAASVLSSSRLESCANDGSEEMDCEMKMVLTVTLEHGQQSTESAQFLVQEVMDADKKVQKLKKPWQVSWEKSQAFWRYPLRYVQDVNNKPKEGIKQVGWLQCNDNPKSTAEAITCDVAYLGDTRVPDSEGFCCGCDVGKVVSGEASRGTATCDLFSMSDTAHCLNFDELWYSVFEVAPPQIFYDITVRLQIPSAYVNGWSNVTYSETQMVLSHQQPTAAVSEGTLRAELVGDLATAVAPHRFESKYLVVPARPIGHELVDSIEPMKNAMLLDRSLFDLSGRTCDKIGVSYTAFRYQPESCHRPAGSCLYEQLDDFHKEDTARLQSGQQPQNLVSRYCEGDMKWVTEGTSGMQFLLACPMTQRHTTLMRLEARAESAMFVTNVAPGRIIKAEAPTFEALSGSGEADLSIINIGAVLADFTLGLTDCAAGLEAGPAVQVSLKPLESTSRQIRLYVSGDGSGKFDCNVTLLDALGELTDSVLLKVNISSLERDTGAQGGNGSGGGDTNLPATISGGTCATTCPSFIDVMCFVAHGCWDRVGILVLVVVLVLVAAYAFCWASLRGLPCRLLGCLCNCLMPRSQESGPSWHWNQQAAMAQVAMAQQTMAQQTMAQQAMAQQAALAQQAANGPVGILPQVALAQGQIPIYGQTDDYDLEQAQGAAPSRRSRSVRLPQAPPRSSRIKVTKNPPAKTQLAPKIKATKKAKSKPVNQL